MNDHAKSLDTHPEFTLLELLLVLGILAILASILAPVFTRVREARLMAVCQNNLRQIGQATRLYSLDNDGFFPSSGSEADGGDLTGNLGAYVRRMSAPEIWVCPIHSGRPSESGYTSSYGYNCQYLLAPGSDYPHTGYTGFDSAGVSQSFLAHPSNTVLFLDHTQPQGNEELWSYVARPGERPILDGFGRPDFRHNGKANALFCDGHVRSVGPEFAQNAEPTYWDPRETNRAETNERNGK